MTFDDALHLLREIHDFLSFLPLKEMMLPSFSLLHSHVCHF
jgi:hypothetical protein